MTGVSNGFRFKQCKIIQGSLENLQLHFKQLMSDPRPTVGVIQGMKGNKK